MVSKVHYSPMGAGDFCRDETTPRFPKSPYESTSFTSEVPHAYTIARIRYWELRACSWHQPAPQLSHRPSGLYAQRFVGVFSLRL